MKTTRTGWALACAGIGAMAARRLLAGRHERRDEAGRWLVVTVHDSPERIGAGGRLPEPMMRLGDRIDVRIEPAAGDKGTELGARLKDPSPSADALVEVRTALREAKSIIETGEVLQADARPSAHPGPAGKLLRLADRTSRGRGRL